LQKNFYFQERGLKKRDFRQIQGNHFITSKSLFVYLPILPFSLDFHNKKNGGILIMEFSHFIIFLFITGHPIMIFIQSRIISAG
jgi:hypothetical protein